MEYFPIELRQGANGTEILASALTQMYFRWYFRGGGGGASALTQMYFK